MQELAVHHIGRLAEAVKALIAAANKINVPNGDTLLHCATRKGEPAVVRLLIQHGANLSSCSKKHS